MAYPLYLVKSQGMPRDHHALFVRFGSENEPDRLFNVTGNIMSGMAYEVVDSAQPEASPTFIGMQQLGWVLSSDSDRMDDICRGNPAPGKQFDGPRRIDPNKPLRRRCQEWTTEAIQMLRDAGVLRDSRPGGPP